MPLEVDDLLSAELTDAIVQWQATRPRTLQKTIGPSGVGGCREFLRATVAGDEGIPERPRAIDAAYIGTVVGDHIESIWANYFPGLRTQVPITCRLPRSGLTIAGHCDAVQGPSELHPHGRIIDLKSKDKLADIKREGPTLENMIQVAVYTYGAHQMGLVEEGAYAALAYYDRSGKDQRIAAGRLEWDAALRFIDLLEDRVEQVAEIIAAGSPEESRWFLRDKPPSWCFATQCPFRRNCWGGSDHTPSGTIEHPDELDAVRRYIQARDDEKDAAARKAAARQDLIPIAGVTAGPIPGLTASPVIVGWTKSTINVTEV